MLQQGLLALLWFVMAALRLERGATLHWALATAAVSAGLVLVGQRDSLPVCAGFWLSNALALAGFMGVRRGVAVFTHRPRADLEQLLFWCASLALLALALRHEQVAAVVGLTSASFAYVMLRTAWTVHRHLGAEFGPRIATASAGPFALIGIVFLARALTAALLPQVLGHSLHVANVVNLYTTLAFLLGGLLLHIGLTGLVFTRLLLRLRHLSEHDELTGLLNRRAIHRRLHDEAERLARYRQPFGVLSIDADHFKAINDRHGHPAGDEVLRALARALLAVSRTTDLAARTGGEEFWLLMPNTDRAGALQVAERLQRTSRELQVQGPGGLIGLTVSIGAAVAEHPGELLPSLMQRVDAALYRAKAAGRDRIEFAEPPAPPP